MSESDPAPESRVSEAETSSDVFRRGIGDREFVIVGTAHISQESTDLVRSVIAAEKPDVVCVELDARRHKALSDPEAWKNLDLKQVIRKKQLSALIAHLVLGSYQKRLGAKLGVTPGAELLAAAKIAEELNIPVELSDRDVGVTLKRAWKMTPFHKKLLLMATLLASVFESPEIDEEKLKEIRKQDVLSQMLQELGQQMPDLKRVLIDERDVYLADRIKGAQGRKVVAVVGAGHVKGLLKRLESDEAPDFAALEHVPPTSRLWKAAGYAIPALVVGSILGIGYRQGSGEALANLQYWFFVNAVPCALGATAALAHPVTILAAFLSAPFTSLTPIIGAGYVTAFVQVWMTPPRIKEIESVGDDLGRVANWWRNRLLRVFLAFFLPSLGSVLGTYLGGWEIVGNLFGKPEEAPVKEIETEGGAEAAFRDEGPSRIVVDCQRLRSGAPLADCVVAIVGERPGSESALASVA